MVKRSKAETEKFYRELVAERARSGLSVRAFAAARGMPSGTLSSWMHKLRRRDAGGTSGRTSLVKPRFVRVSVVGGDGGTCAEELPPAHAVYEVVLERGLVLRLPRDFEEERVAALVRAVTSC